MRRPMDMADTLAVEEPPAKKLCRQHEVVGQTELPADDDDDFYDTAPVKPPSRSPAVEHPLSNTASALSPAATALPSLAIPGLGLLSATHDKTSPPAEAPVPDPGLEEEKKADESAPEAPVQNGGQEEELRAEFLRAGEANKGDENAEWQLDSSDSDSSSDSSSDDSSDESSEDEGLLLGPEEQARLLMQMEEEGEPGAGAAANIKTTNEVEETFEKPKITVTEDMRITELGPVESVVGNMVLIKANMSGDQQVLEAGSALCLADRTVIGQVSETLGRVHEPRYSLGFNESSEIPAFGITKGTIIYYVNEHSKFVFTEPLKKQKFTDASNLHDEEADDTEFSDDEKEAEFKRKKKLEKKARAGQLHTTSDAPAVPQKNEYQSGGLNYSDDEEDGMYKPLARPEHFEEIVGRGAPIEDRSHVRRGNPRPARGFRGRGGGGGGRGDRGGGRGRGDRGDRFARGGRYQEQNRRDNRHKQSSPQAARSPRPSKSPVQRRRGPPERPRPGASPAQETSAPAAVNVQATAWNQASYPYNNASNPQAASSQYPPVSNPYMPVNPMPNPTLPAGAFINPSFQQPPQVAPSQGQPQAAQQANWMAWAQFFSTMQQQAHPPAPVANSNSQGADPQASAQAIQHNLDILRNLARGPGSS